MRQSLIKNMKNIDAQAVESYTRPGIPDVDSVYGHIELKWLKSWPKREETLVALDHYTKVQRIWHKRRIRKNGVVYVLLQVGREWLLFDGQRAANYLGILCQEDLIKASVKYWNNGVNWAEFENYLKDTFIQKYSNSLN